MTTSNIEWDQRFGTLSFVRDLGVRSILAVPMLIGTRAIGAFALYSLKLDHFTDDRSHVTQAIANQTAIALERARLFNNLSQSYDRTLDALVAALDARDKETEGHSLRVVTYTLALARQMNVPEESLVTIRRGALLHDIGKIAIPDAILHKEGPLTEEEWAIMRRHPEWGEKILAGIQFLAEAAQIVIAHHERWDGTGYPRGLAGEDIPLGARIFAVADAFDAITSERPYRSARPYSVARDEILAGSGSQFDPRVVEAFLQLSEAEWREMRAQVEDQQRAVEDLPARFGPDPVRAAVGTNGSRDRTHEGVKTSGSLGGKARPRDPEPGG